MDQSKGLMSPRPWLLLLIGMVVLSPILYVIDYSSVQPKGSTRRLKPAPQQFQPPLRLSCDSKLNRTSDKDSPKLLLVVGAPGSGNDWARLIFTLLTGLRSEWVGAAKRLKNISTLYNKVCYYKSHYPYINRTMGEIVDHLHEHPDRLVVLLRNPFDAAFSEYTRVTQSKKNKGRMKVKYNNFGLLTIDDYLAVDESTGKRTKPSHAVVAHFKHFLVLWKKFYRHWLEKYKGSFRLYIYNDLVQNSLLFLDMANYFGFVADTGIQKKHQEQCLIQYMEEASAKRRPVSALLDNAKMILKEYFSEKFSKAKTDVETLLKRKYNKEIIL